MSQPRWSVAVVGPGGVGGLLGAILTKAGHNVIFLARPDTAAALNSDGVTVRSGQFGDFHVPAVAVPQLDAPVDVCLVAVKATALDKALDGVPADILENGLILPMLNGIEHMATLRTRYPAAQVVAGAITVESTRVAPGRIEHTSPFCRIEIASDAGPKERIQQLAAQLTQAGLDVNVRDDEATLLWDKLAFLAPFALLTTHAQGPVDVIRTRRRADLDAMIDEVVAVAEADGAKVSSAAIYAKFDGAYVGMKSSMQRDTEANRPTELDAIGGAVLSAAQRHGIDAPVTRRIVDELRSRQT